LNITRVRTSSSSTTTKLAIDESRRNFGDPDPSSAGLSYTIHHLDTNSNPSAGGPGSQRRKKKKTRNKWNHHSPSSKFGIAAAAAKTTPAGQPFWTRNDILESPTTKPPPTYSDQ
jgi:hypothetical protein